MELLSNIRSIVLDASTFARNLCRSRTADPSPVEIGAKCGFGLAPEKPTTRKKREAAIRQTLAILRDGDFIATETKVASLSETKGLFRRAVKQDQWDWFVVWMQIGTPPRWLARETSNLIPRLRRAMITEDASAAERYAIKLLRRGIVRQLEGYLSGESRLDQGCLYIRETREQELLSIGV